MFCHISIYELPWTDGNFFRIVFLFRFVFTCDIPFNNDNCAFARASIPVVRFIHTFTWMILCIYVGSMNSAKLNDFIWLKEQYDEQTRKIDISGAATISNNNFFSSNIAENANSLKRSQVTSLQMSVWKNFACIFWVHWMLSFSKRHTIFQFEAVFSVHWWSMKASNGISEFSVQLSLISSSYQFQ